MKMTRTPLRVSLFGGGSDYPEYFDRSEGGAVLGMAIDKFVYVGVKRMPPGQTVDGKPIQFRVQYSRVDDALSIDEVRHPAVRAALRYLGITDRLEFHIMGDLPGRSGLGGSSAFTVGVLGAVQALLGIKGLPPVEAWREAVPFERFAIDETVGFQDQVFASTGGVKLVELREGSASVRNLDLNGAVQAELERSLVLVYSGTMRDAHVMARAQIDRVDSNLITLREMAAQAREGFSVLWSGNLRLLGPMLRDAWSMKRRTLPEMTTSAIDEVIDEGLLSGSTGGKLLGAGGGGFILFYVPPEEMDRFVERMSEKHHCVRFRISHRGTSLVNLEG